MSFPKEKLRPDDKALVLFCAAFGGAQDAINFREVGLTDVTCLDADQGKLEAMMVVYPKPWLFICGDAFEEIDDRKPKSYDVVTCDQFSNHDTDIIKRVPKLLEIARRLVLISWCADGPTSMKYLVTALIAAADGGWTIELRLRSTHCGGCFWIVFEKAAK